MDVTNQTDDEQARLWNGHAGRAWGEAQEVLDQMLRPFEDLLVQAACAAYGGRVLDVGCGTGSTTLAVARRLGAKGRCIGVDISGPMIAAARAANLRRAAKDDAEFRFIAWRSASENPFMTTAERAAVPLLPNLPSRRPDAPGQFAFADRRRVYNILKESGWAEIDIRPIDVVCTLPEKELIRYLTWLGPVGLILQQADDQTRTQVIDAVRAAFDPYVHGAEVRFAAACWMVCARASSASSAYIHMPG